MSSLTATLSDSAVIAKRNLIKVKRVPDIIVFATLSPIMFVLLFRYVFGGAIQLPPGTSYGEFLLPGIFAQTIVLGSTTTGASLAEDLQKGLIDRFRSLPMSRSAVLIGRTVADAGLNVISITVMALTGLVVGWRINSSVGEAVAGFLLLLAFAFAISWLTRSYRWRASPPCSAPSRSGTRSPRWSRPRASCSATPPRSPRHRMPGRCRTR
ncbi:MAG: Efflux ABC transporter, permease protein [uncultured Nocardioidaceae bacterium]|uniref:Efflux ABC transporter, permease protein n=1 Tax=uncultured Nocardioidaceae bacterium TaxID=253824 RepID=A0A6J4LIK8_9ACTN|nr:MAG: Efflux ABC transporter, permease protein [uncultured Nocardioidaceae bacterium]